MIPIQHKKRLVAALLLTVLLWPAVHHVLVRRCQLNPWLLFGMGMYCQMQRVEDFTVVQRNNGMPVPIDPSRLTPELQHGAERFRLRWKNLGILADPEPLARALLQQLPDAEAVLFARRRAFLDPGSARIVYVQEIRTIERK